MIAAPELSISAVLSGKSAKDENFPVASRLIAPEHRGIVLAFYRFVRAADDVVDHAVLTAAGKHALIDRLEAGLLGQAIEPEAEPLRLALAARGMVPRHPLDLLMAFRRDIDNARTVDWDDLIDYCRYSAMPVGRFVLDVHGEDEWLWPANDALCAALQIINHVQDCAKDFRTIDRIYLPADLMGHHRVVPIDLGASASSPGLRALLHEILRRTKELLANSAAFAPAIRDIRLALEVAVIQSIAERLTRLLDRKDPLADDVHLRKAQYLLAGMGGAARLIWCRMSGSRQMPAAGTTEQRT